MVEPNEKLINYDIDYNQEVKFFKISSKPRFAFIKQEQDLSPNVVK
jgi:hypothetical protein